MKHCVTRWVAAAACAAVAGCAQWPEQPGAGVESSPWATVPAATPAAGRWAHYPLPGKSAARWRSVRADGRDAMAVTAVSAASMLRRTVRVEPEELGRLRFSWNVAELMDQADLGARDKADSPVRVILVFEGDRSRLSQRDQLLSELTRSVTGEELPYATLMYVWCNRRATGTVIHNTRTSRIRKIVLESGRASLGRWLDYERDIRADYERAFGEQPGRLVGLAVMTDSDNTRSTAQALYGPVSLLPALAGARP